MNGDVQVRFCEKPGGKLPGLTRLYGSEAGADAGSTWLSLVLTARMHGLHVEEYLRDLFRVLPAWPQSRILELAPHCWPGTRVKLNPLELLQELGPVTIPPK